MPDKRIVIALAPGAVGPAKRWPVSSYADLGRRLVGEGHRVWIVGGPSECALAAEIAASAPDAIRNLTGSDLRNAILALARRLRREGYGQALVMPRTWKSALALFLAGIPQRTGFVGEGRFGLCMRDITVGQLMAATRAAIRAGRTAPGTGQRDRVR